MSEGRAQPTGSMVLLTSTLKRMQYDAVRLTLDAYRDRYGPSAVARTVWREMERRAIDAPQPERVAIYHPDEREARYDKPLIYADYRDGRRPVVIVGGGTEHTGALAEMAEEIRHYGSDEPAAVQARQRPNVQALWSEYIETAHRRQQGITLNGPLRRRD